MTEHYPGDSEIIERALLWDDIRTLFQTHAYTIGIQTKDTENHFRLVLAGVLNENYILQLWGKWTSGVGLSQASLIYQDKHAYENGHYAEAYNYNIYGTDISEYASAPRDLDKEHIEGM